MTGAPRDSHPVKTWGTLEGRALVERCLARDPEALDVLEAFYIARTDPALEALGLAPDDRDEVRQMLRVRLLLGERPRLAEYRGEGSLLAFVRAVALRLALEEKRRRSHAADESELLALADAADDPERALTKRVGRAQFRAAFEAAIASLDPRQRMVLRQAYVDGLSNEAIAHLHGMHRTTVFRAIIAARRMLAARLREELARSLRLPPAEVARFAALLGSDLCLSLPRMLS